MSYAFQADGLVKRYGKTVALAGADLAAEPGSALGLLDLCRAAAWARAGELLARFGLAEVAGRRVATYSGACGGAWTRPRAWSGTRR